ncbi:TPA: relaxase/mobilization nuclease domain-containing protein, partial [Campylobacter jejuni]|nr:relaxase/mobilization nuclease domain-containing protein [Campylobacter jejuni]HEG5598976.1 relaxase/mobilization nuclease domain-containing protein [Campylobacter jejuni]
KAILWQKIIKNKIPEQAHKNAVELAEHTKAWKGHEVLIATHIDKGHIHTHFIVNSVNYENGHKLQWM